MCDRRRGVGGVAPDFLALQSASHAMPLLKLLLPTPLVTRPPFRPPPPHLPCCLLLLLMLLLYWQYNPSLTLQGDAQSVEKVP